MEFCSEHEISGGRYSARPRFGRGQCERPIETTIDFDRVEESREILERIKLRTRLLRVDDAFPVFVRPAGGSMWIRLPSITSPKLILSGRLKEIRDTRNRRRGSGLSLSCSVRKAMRSRRAAALSAWGASYNANRFGSLTTAAYKRARSGVRNFSCEPYWRNTTAGAAWETYLPWSVQAYFSIYASNFSAPTSCDTADIPVFSYSLHQTSCLPSGRKP